MAFFTQPARRKQPHPRSLSHRRTVVKRLHRALCLEPLEQRQLLTVTILGPDNRQVVHQPDQGFFRAAGQLEIWFPRNQNPTFDNVNGTCSGVMISRRHVLTSAHCFYDNSSPQHDEVGESVGPRANIIAFTPGRQGKFGRPFGTAYAVRLRTYNTYRSSQDPAFDVALVTLDRNLGDTVGWFGASAFSDSSYPRNVNVLGYPGTESGRFDGYTMTLQFEQAFLAQTNDRFLRSTRIDSEGGHSGGPWFNYNSDTQEVRVLGVMKGGDPAQGRTIAVRLSNSMIDDFREAIEADLAGQSGGGSSGRGFANDPVNSGGSTSTVDLPDLVDYDQWFDSSVSTVSHTLVRPGDFFGATAWVQNTGTANAGPFAVSFFASPDPNIDPFDFFLGSAQVSFAGPFQSVAASLTTLFPNLPPGAYFIGWIIDSSNAQAEFNENNNAGMFRGGPITVPPQNQGPIALDDAYAVDQGDVLEIPFPGVLANDFDPDSPFLEAIIVTEPAHGTFQLHPLGGFIYTPDPNFHGQDAFTYLAGDGQLLSNLATVLLEVRRVNAAPRAAPDQATTKQNRAVALDVLANDADADGELDPSSVEIAMPPDMGEAIVLADGRIQFVPASGFSGEATFSYTVADREGRRSNAAMVAVTVEAVYEWQNVNIHADVNANGSVDVADLLAIVQYLRSGKPRTLDQVAKGAAEGFVDVNGDRSVSLADLLEVVRVMRTASARNGGEGEHASPSADAWDGSRWPDFWSDELDLLAADVTRRKLRDETMQGLNLVG